MKKINLTKIQADIDSQQLSASQPLRKRTEQQEQVIEKIWKTLTGIYGSALVSQYGEVMPEEWIALLKGITPSQILAGLGKIRERKSNFTINGQEFAQLCLPDTISPDGTNSAAYLYIGDPKHPIARREAKLALESDSYKSKKLKKGNSAIKDMLGDLK